MKQKREKNITKLQEREEKGTKRTVVRVDGSRSCNTSPVLIGELINVSVVRTWKKLRVPCDCIAI